jgi:hypothetical protein
VFGHTHEPKCEQVGPVTLYNAGFWSLAFADPECTTRLGEQTFVWIRPTIEGAGRTAELCRWRTGEEKPMHALCVEPTASSQMEPSPVLPETERGLA